MSTIPEFIILIPYRDREAHKNVFLHHMPYILEDVDSSTYEIAFIHQQDSKGFNRGAVKNIGFLYVKNKYPNHYKHITLVFHDVDIMPGKKGLWDYKTTKGTVKHFFGFTFALGGIVSITGVDFEKCNGFPNLWGWGMEDNALQNRCNTHNIKIDRSEFYPLNHKDILQYNNGYARVLDNTVTHKFNNIRNGISSINNVKYNVSTYTHCIQHSIVNVTNWDIPEKEEDVVYETKRNPAVISQRKVNMGNIMKFNRKRK